MLAGTKKCSPTTCSGRFVIGGQSVDIERRSIAGQDRARLGDARRACERPRFLTSRFSNTASTTTSASARSVQSSLKRIDWPRFHASSCVSRPFCTWYMNMPITVWRALSTASSLLIDDHDRNAGLRERDRDAGAHRAGSDDAGALDVLQRASRGGNAGNLRELAFGKEQMPQRGRRRRAHQLVEQPVFARDARTETAARRRPATASISLCAAKPPRSSGGTILCACATTNGRSLHRNVLGDDRSPLRDATLGHHRRLPFAASTTSPGVTSSSMPSSSARDAACDDRP